MNDCLAELTRLVRPHLKFLAPTDPLTPDMSLGQAGLDSMASISLLVEMEEAFGISIPDELLSENSFSTLNSLRELVESASAVAS